LLVADGCVLLLRAASCCYYRPVVIPSEARLSSRAERGILIVAEGPRSAA